MYSWCVGIDTSKRRAPLRTRRSETVKTNYKSDPERERERDACNFAVEQVHANLRKTGAPARMINSFLSNDNV